MSQNSRPVVLIADKLAQSTVDALGDSVEVRWVDGPNRPELLEAVKDADALLVRSATTVDAEVLAAAPKLQIVGRAGVGLDNVDIETATAKGVMVANAPTSNIHSACEHAIALLLSAARQIPAADKTLRDAEWKRSSFKGVEIFGKTVGIVGFGHIGQLFAQRLAAFETEIVAYDPYANPARAAQLGVELVELDELVAPVIALERYVNATGDAGLLSMPCVTGGIERILRTLKSVRHESEPLYETFLMPTDDMHTYPYLTYDNVLVWRALRALAWLCPERYGALKREAEAVREAVYNRCTADGGSGRYFVWSTDLAGRSDVYDEPPGSLLLLPYLGFCAGDDPIWLNTARMIRSPDYAYSFAGCEFADIGCAHAPHPWLPSVANSLLSGESGRALDILRRAALDNGIVCESIDEHTGECATGEHFATAAGFVCHALRRALGGVEYEE